MGSYTDFTDFYKKTDATIIRRNTHAVRQIQPYKASLKERLNSDFAKTAIFKG
jgi:hypothetical protein